MLNTAQSEHARAPGIGNFGIYEGEQGTLIVVDEPYRQLLVGDLRWRYVGTSHIVIEEGPAEREVCRFKLEGTLAERDPVFLNSMRRLDLLIQIGLGELNPLTITPARGGGMLLS